MTEFDDEQVELTGHDASSTEEPTESTDESTVEPAGALPTRSPRTINAFAIASPDRV